MYQLRLGLAHPTIKKSVLKMTIEYKGCTKKIVPFSKFESGLLTRTVCPRRLSFSQFNVLVANTVGL